MSHLDGFRNELIKKASAFSKLKRVAPAVATAAGLGTGIAGAAMAYRGQQERKKYMAATTGAIRTLGREALKARGERVTLGRALAINSKADMISRNVLAKAIRNNYAQDANRARAVLKLHGVKFAPSKNK